MTRQGAMAGAAAARTLEASTVEASTPRVEGEPVRTVYTMPVERTEPAEVVHCALLDVTLARERLHRALTGDQPEIVLSAATGATSAWLSAAAALGRVRAREAAACQRARQAEQAVGRSRVELVAQLERTLAHDVPPEVRDQLQQLAHGLALAGDDGHHPGGAP